MRTGTHRPSSFACGAYSTVTMPRASSDVTVSSVLTMRPVVRSIQKRPVAGEWLAVRIMRGLYSSLKRSLASSEADPYPDRTRRQARDRASGKPYRQGEGSSGLPCFVFSSNSCFCGPNSIGVYDDRLSDAIPEELWNSKSAALQDELRRVRTEMERHEVASQAYETAGLQILELAQTAYSSYVAKNPHEQARLIKTLVSNSTFDRGSLSPTYVKPFDVFAKASETGDWLLGLDSNQQPSG